MITALDNVTREAVGVRERRRERVADPGEDSKERVCCCTVTSCLCEMRSMRSCLEEEDV